MTLCWVNKASYKRQIVYASTRSTNKYLSKQEIERRKREVSQVHNFVLTRQKPWGGRQCGAVIYGGRDTNHLHSVRRAVCWELVIIITSFGFLRPGLLCSSHRLELVMKMRLHKIHRDLLVFAPQRWNWNTHDNILLGVILQQSNRKEKQTKSPGQGSTTPWESEQDDQEFWVSLCYFTSSQSALTTKDCLKKRKNWNKQKN